jgi:hypothetical protein
MVQIILHTTANLKGSDILYNTQPQTLHCNPSPALTSPSIFDNRPALASQAPPGLSSPSFSLRNAGTKRGYETRTASVPNTNRVPIYRIRTPESSDLPITATGDNPSNHSLHSTYTRRAKTVRTAHYVTTYHAPLIPRPRRSNVYWQRQRGSGSLPIDTLCYLPIPLNTLHSTTLLHLPRGLRGAA